MPVLKIRQLSKQFGAKHLLDKIELELATGDCIGLFGRNGSGKSTLLRILFGTLKAGSLELFLDQQPLAIKDVIPQQLIAFLPQDHFLPPGLRVREIIPLYFRQGEQQDRIFYAPRIAELAARRFGQLSIGEKRYFEFLLIAHLPHPFLLLDEPFAMIEPIYQELIQQHIRLLRYSKGILLTDHYYANVWAVSTRSLVLKNGSLRTVSHLEDLIEYGYLVQKME